MHFSSPNIWILDIPIPLFLLLRTGWTELFHQYEWNARTQVTMWYDNTETEQSKLHDYGNGQYNGTVSLVV
jgi:hypothetical protein